MVNISYTPEEWDQRFSCFPCKTRSDCNRTDYCKLTDVFGDRVPESARLRSAARMARAGPSEGSYKIIIARSRILLYAYSRCRAMFGHLAIRMDVVLDPVALTM